MLSGNGAAYLLDLFFLFINSEIRIEALVMVIPPRILIPTFLMNFNCFTVARFLKDPRGFNLS